MPTRSPSPERCPVCDEPRFGRFCEKCGNQFSEGEPSSGQPSGARRWYAVVAPDRAYFETLGETAHGFQFPASSQARRIPLMGSRIRIGRKSVSRQIFPEIDLSQAPEDPGVSREHAVLVARSDGSWSMFDERSSNGTFVNGRLIPIPKDVETPLSDGDRIHVGAWTTITVREERDF